MATFIAINGVEGSDVTFDFDGSTTIELTAHSASPTNPANTLPGADCTWSLLDAPAGSGFDSAWFAANTVGWPNANTIPTAPSTFIADKEGTWLFRCDNADGTSDQVVVGVRSNRSDIRIPAAGETIEADTDRGWAVDRDAALYTFDDLMTTGGVQVCKLVEPAAPLVAGALLSFTGIDDIDPITNEKVPRVALASTDVNPNYAGVLKSDADGAITAIANNSYVLVSRSGIVTGGAAATLDLSAFSVGDIVYLDTSANAGDPFRDTDSFASAVGSFPDTMIPAGVVVDAANPGKILAVPGLKYTGDSATNATFRYKGIGDFSSLRVGRSDGLTIAGEADGTVEILATAQENIAQGNVVCISSLGAYIADSSYNMRTLIPFQIYRQDGIFAVAVEAVLSGAVGHFTVFGQCDNALTSSPGAGEVLYVGSSSASTSTAGQLVKRGILQAPSSLPKQYPVGNVAPPSKFIPVGVYENGKVQMGTFQDDGIVHKVQSTKYHTDGENLAWNSNVLSVDNSNVYHPVSVGDTDGLANVNLPDTITDVSADATVLFESPVMGDSLYDVANDQLGGKSFPGGNDTPGAPMETAVWNPSALGNPVELFGSFSLDDRYKNGVNPVHIEVHGYTDNSGAGTISIGVNLRPNACGKNIDAGMVSLAPKDHVSTASATKTAACLRFPFYTDSAGNPDKFIGILDQISGTDIGTLDFSLERFDAVNTGFIITKVVLVSNYSIVNRLENNIEAVYEHQELGHAIYDARVHSSLVSEQTIGVDHTVGFSMSDAIGTGTGFPVGVVPLDNRVDVRDMDIRIVGQYRGGIPVTSVDLQLSVRLEYCGVFYADTIGAGSFQATVSATPAVDTSAGNEYEVLCFDYTIPQATFALLGIHGPAGMPMLHYRIDRTGTNPAVGETFFHITNVQFTQSGADPAREEIFENHLPTVFSIDGISGGYNFTPGADALADYGGFRMPSGGGETLLAAVNFDGRYNERDSIEVTVIGAISSAGAEVDLNFEWESLYCNGTVPALANYQPRKTGDFDTSAYAADVQITCHTFFLSAHEIWGGNGIPTGAPIDHSSLMLKISRKDTSGNLYTVLAISAQSEESKRIKPFDGYINISENRTATDRTRLLIPGSFRHDFEDDVLLSTQRYTWMYGLDGSTVVADGSDITLMPSGMLAPIVVGSGQPGHLVPYSMAIVGVFGWTEDSVLDTNAFTSCTLSLKLYEAPNLGAAAASKDSENGVYHMPLRVSIDATDNTFRWTGNDLNTVLSDTHNLPLIYLPSGYSTAGGFTRWVLAAELSNGSGGPLSPIVNMMVEVALLPTAE